MKDRIYQGVQLSKKESELVQWLQRGEHTWWDAFYMYPQRRKPTRLDRNVGGLKERSWFNRTLTTLQKKGLCTNIPHIYTGLPWRNPGINASKANLVAMSVQDVNVEAVEKRKKII